MAAISPGSLPSYFPGVCPLSRKQLQKEAEKDGREFVAAAFAAAWAMTDAAAGSAATAPCDYSAAAAAAAPNACLTTWSARTVRLISSNTAVKKIT